MSRTKTATVESYTPYLPPQVEIETQDITMPAYLGSRVLSAPDVAPDRFDNGVSTIYATVWVVQENTTLGNDINQTIAVGEQILIRTYTAGSKVWLRSNTVVRAGHGVFPATAGNTGTVTEDVAGFTDATIAIAETATTGTPNELLLVTIM